ncbi:MAG TPA: cation diffusion facilitator family transporter [Lentimicrobium sp.]|nr:cation diffusion facilitator family transporter [Lentimicrobium sp.]
MHSHNHHHPDHDSGLKNIKLAFVLNLVFSLIEAVGGLYTNSVAILSDALHDVGDSASLGIAWFLQKKSNKKRDEYYSYGYRRFSLLGAIFISFILVISSIFIIRESVTRIAHPEIPNASGMLLLSIVGIIVNGFAAYRLKSGDSFNERAVSIHLLEDVLGWIAVLIVSIVLYFKNLSILDPLLSLGITIWVLSNVYRNLRDTFRVLMQEVPQDIDVESMLSKIRSLPFIQSIHDFHLWSLDGKRNIMTIHVVTNQNFPPNGEKELKQEIRELASSYKIDHVTLELENENESEDCEFKEGC